MVRIRCESLKGQTNVTSWENLCFYTLILISLVADEQQPEILDLLLLSVLLFFPLWLLAAAVGRYKLSKIPARPLRRDEAPAIFDLLNHECSRLGIARTPKLYVADRYARVSARVLGGFGYKIIVSGGMCVLAARKRETARIILDHELGHLRGGDTKLWMYVGLVVLGVVTSLIDPQNISRAFADTIILGLLLMYFLRRREYLADAFALNWTDSATEYLDVLGMAVERKKRRWFHPTLEDRRCAIEARSPVLSTSGFILLFYGFVLAGGFQQTRTFINEHSFSDVKSTWVIFLLPSAIAIVGLVTELSKGVRYKRPLPLGQPLSRKLFTSWRGSAVASALGVDGASLRWWNILSFVISYTVVDLSLSFNLRHHFGRAPGVFRNVSGGYLIILDVFWCLIALLVFRYVHGTLAAPTIGAVVYVMVVSAGFGGLSPPEIIRHFALTFGALLGFALALRKIHRVWLALIVGALALWPLTRLLAGHSDMAIPGSLIKLILIETVPSFVFAMVFYASLRIGKKLVSA